LSQSPVIDPADDAERRRRVRRTAILLAVLAAAFYFGFIVLAVTRGING
jgi:hypothetical protein